MARGAPDGDRQGGQGKSAGSQELGEVDTGRWQRKEPNFTFVTEGRKNRSSS